GPERAHVGEDLVLEDELVRQLNGLRRVVPVVVVLPDDLAPVDAFLAVGPLAVVDPVEVRLHAARNRRVQRRRPTERKRATYSDRRLRHTRRRGRVSAIVGPCECAGNADGERCQHRRERNEGSVHESPSSRSAPLPLLRTSTAENCSTAEGCALSLLRKS